jgi:hypothetical protein
LVFGFIRLRSSGLLDSLFVDKMALSRTGIPVAWKFSRAGNKAIRASRRSAASLNDCSFGPRLRDCRRSLNESDTRCLLLGIE